MRVVASRMEWTGARTLDRGDDRVRRDGARTGDDGPRTGLLLMFVQASTLFPLAVVLGVQYPTIKQNYINL